ncbi:MAG: DUF4157 domain-containing protein [Nitrospira sp.]|nr:DUF4157 domain-containing protein [Nitrospira sp.]
MPRVTSQERPPAKGDSYDGVGPRMFVPQLSRIAIFAGGRAPVAACPAVSHPLDPVEREASRMADQVMRNETPTVPVRAAFDQGPQRFGTTSRDPAAIQPMGPLPTGSRGYPIEAAVRGFYERRFGVDFSQVKIFADSHAARAAASVNARAFSRGEQIVFGRGAYAPATSAGRELMAHELAHVVQQRIAQTPSNRLYRRPQENPEVMQAEVQRLAQELNQLAAKNAWAGVDRTYRQLETLGDGVFALATDPAALHFFGAQAARNLGDIRRYKSLVQRAKTALLAAGRPADDAQLQTLEAELTAIDQAYGAVSIAPRSKRSADAKKGETVGPELVPAAMPFAGDQRESVERARTQILETGSFSGLLPAGAYTLGAESFTVIAGTNVPEVLWGS